jgi:hemerythrin-like metal-binding protein
MKQSVAELLQLVGSSGQNTVAYRNEPTVHRSAPQKIPVSANPGSNDIISWNEEKMSTGFTPVDEEHQELIQRINDLHAACVAGKAREQLMDQLDFLGNYAQSHFANEERIMAEHNCPSRTQNQMAHAKFLKDYERVVAMVREYGASTRAAIELKQMLGDWLNNHICRIDTGLRKCPGAHGKDSRSMTAQRRSQIPLEDNFKDF